MVFRNEDLVHAILKVKPAVVYAAALLGLVFGRPPLQPHDVPEQRKTGSNKIFTETVANERLSLCVTKFHRHTRFISLMQ
jgi:hypothetical protein